MSCVIRETSMRIKALALVSTAFAGAGIAHCMPPFQYVEVGRERGIFPYQMASTALALDRGTYWGGGVAAADFDDDGDVDLFVPNDTGVPDQLYRNLGDGRFEEIAEEDWRSIFEANVDGAFWLTQAVAPIMKQAAYGRVVNIASSAGLRPSLTGIQAYTAAKHALVGLTKQLSWELGPHGITVNAIAPGLILSNPTTIRQWDNYGPERQKQFLESIHTKRLGTPEDIANATLFFADESSGWISGQILSVDGGRS